MNNVPQRYRAFLLRLWPEQSGGASADCWRATLEDARTGQRLGFASLEQLFAHLLQLAESSAENQGEASRSDQALSDRDNAEQA